VRPIAPRIEGAEEYTIAEDQLEFSPIVACHIQYPGGRIDRICRWTFTPEERARIAAGEDIYFGTPASLQLIPHYLTVGSPTGESSA
jgi:hypothetical protein